ncbi:hypothetical protein FRB97_004301 [Tulasnella sp. 331]|nr:hypothetical protein FRB97_004301 [Tulasnella sp. 331]
MSWAASQTVQQAKFCGGIGKIIDWALRLRGCDLCMDHNLEDEVFIPEIFPDLEDVDQFLDLIPHSIKEDEMTADGERWYLRSDIIKMAAIVKVWENRILTKVPGAAQDYDAFRTQCKARVGAIMKKKKDCLRWSEERARLMFDHRRSLTAKRRDKIVARLSEAGHDPRDIKTILDEPLVNRPVEIIESRWEAMSKKLTELVNVAKEYRLEGERANLVKLRRDVAIAVYFQYKKRAGLGHNSPAPSGEEIVACPPFRDIIQAGGNAKVTAKDFANAVAMLPGLVKDWRRSRLVRLLKAISNGGGQPVPDKPSNSDLEILKLAKTLFKCRSSGKIWAWGNLEDHSCTSRVQHRRRFGIECLKYDIKASELVESLIIVAGRDPNTTTTEDMDELDARFYCDKCPKGVGLARSWRNCVRVAYLHSFVNHGLWELTDLFVYLTQAAHVAEHRLTEFTGWTLLSPAETEMIIQHELNDTGNPPNRLGCAYCAEEGNTSILAAQHLATKHGKNSPSLQDFRVNRLIAPRPVYLPGPPPLSLPISAKPNKMRIKCKACGPNKTRLFKLTGFIAHAKAV